MLPIAAVELFLWLATAATRDSIQRGLAKREDALHAPWFALGNITYDGVNS